MHEIMLAELRLAEMRAEADRYRLRRSIRRTRNDFRRDRRWRPAA